MSIKQARLASEAFSCAGKHAVVVGATAGIGTGIAMRLAEAGCGVTVVGRSEERGNNLVDKLKLASPQASHAFVQLDAFDLRACAQFAKDRAALPGSLDYLVLTQGMATMQGYTPTPPEKGGMDEKLTLHVYSRALLASQLAAKMSESSADPRVLSVLSAGIHSAAAAYASDPDLSKGYSIKGAADAGGFYNDIYLDSLAARHPTVSFLHAAPGFVSTSWGTEMPTVVRWLVRGLQVFGRSKEDCGELMFKGLYRDEFKGGGFHLIDQHGEAGPSVVKLHEEAKKPVFEHIMAVIQSNM